MSQGVAQRPIFPRDRVTIVGVVNVTPDSFSDGGRFVRERGASVDLAAVRRAGQALVGAGAGVLDVGGESTRPGALEVSLEEELARTLPAVSALAELGEPDVLVSIDTRKASVAKAAIAAGAAIVNDVSGLRHDSELARVVAESGAGLVLGHLRGTPETMQRAPHYEDVLQEVATELGAAVDVARAAGVGSDRLAVDPGIGFGKRLEDNLTLLAHLDWLRDRLGLPIWVGPSRKAFLGTLTGDPVEARDAGSAAACAVAAFAGADAVRVHDPEAVRRAVIVGRALREARRKELT